MLPKDQSTKFIGCLILLGYHTLPSERDYWAEADHFRVTIVNDAMTRNFYFEFKRLLHYIFFKSKPIRLGYKFWA